jgi:hypothetical protein
VSRPKKKLLITSVNQAVLGVWETVFMIRGFNVFACPFGPVAMDANIVNENPDAIVILVARGQKQSVIDLTEVASKRGRGAKVMLLVETRAERLTFAHCNATVMDLQTGENATIIAALRILTNRKRGPRKQVFTAVTEAIA